MTARVYNVADWYGAQRARAMRGKAPRLAVQRGIYLRQSADGRWDVLISERRFGKWGKPEWVCPPGPLQTARAAALTAWRQHKLPLLWTYAGERRVRPFYEGVSEPQAVPA